MRVRHFQGDNCEACEGVPDQFHSNGGIPRGAEGVLERSLRPAHSPRYWEFILSSPAPVDTAAKLSTQFRVLSEREKERTRDLIAAAKFSESMATELMAIAASLSSAKALLTAVDHRGIPFLDVLIENEQKETVAHPSVQRYLSDVWMGSLPWSSYQITLLFVGLLVFPPLWAIFIVPVKVTAQSPDQQVVLKRLPIIKFMGYLSSHLHLIILYFLTVVHPLENTWENLSLLPTWYEWLLLAWLSGLLLSELTNPADRTGIRWFNLMVLVVSAGASVSHVIGFSYPTTDYSRLDCIYIRNQLLALALLLCFILLLDFLLFHHLFGPWAIIIRDLMRDLTRFLVILMIFMAGFTMHLTAIYQPVYPPVSNGTNGSSQIDVDYVPTPVDSFEVLYFSLLGLVGQDQLYTEVSRMPLGSIYVSKVVFGICLLVTLIVLVNLLIAMMSDTYQRIQAQSDTEWMFGRAKLIRNMNKTSATPSPLNLFTKLVSVVYAVAKFRGSMCSRDAVIFTDVEGLRDDESETTASHGLRPTSPGNKGSQTPSETVVDSPNAKKLEEVVNWSHVARKYLAAQRIVIDNDDYDDDGMNLNASKTIAATKDQNPKTGFAAGSRLTMREMAEAALIARKSPPTVKANGPPAGLH